jgi:hypothetical protein
MKWLKSTSEGSRQITDDVHPTIRIKQVKLHAGNRRGLLFGSNDFFGRILIAIVALVAQDQRFTG